MDLDKMAGLSQVGRFIKKKNHSRKGNVRNDLKKKYELAQTLYKNRLTDGNERNNRWKEGRRKGKIKIFRCQVTSNSKEDMTSQEGGQKRWNARP